MSTISVIVPVYQTERYLRQCVDSILDQSFQDFELILVDDGSPDGCGAICDSYARQDERIVVIHQQNKGLSAARNAGIDWVFSHSASQWITFVDSDDWIHPELLERLLEANLKLNTAVSIAFYQQTDGGTEFWTGSPALPFLLTPEALYLDNIGAATVAWGKLYRRACFRDIRYPVGRIHEDEFITYRILFAQNRLAVIRYPFYAYRINPQGIMRSPWTPKRLHLLNALEEQLRFFHSGGYTKILHLRMNTYVGLCIHSLIRLRSKENRHYQAERREVLRKLLLCLFSCAGKRISLSPLMDEYRQWFLRKLHLAHRKAGQHVTANKIENIETNPPILSWIIPVFNGEQYIRQAIESILRQPCRDFEILIVDDGSTDRTASVVQPYLGQQVRLLQKENGGVSTARNLGIREARGRYIAFLDADDVICHGAYTGDIHDLLTDEAYDMISFPYYSADQNLKRGIRHCTEEPQHADPFKHCSSFIYLRSLLTGDEAPCFPEGIRIREDVAFQFLVNHRAERVKKLDRPWFLYRNHVSSVLHRNDGYEYLVLDAIPAWQWCKDRCSQPRERLECDRRIFSEVCAYIRLSCMSGISLPDIQKALALPAVQDALSHYDLLWENARQEYEIFLANPRKYQLYRRMQGIARKITRFLVRLPALRKIYLAIRYREKLDDLR